MKISEKFYKAGLHCEKVYPLDLMLGIKVSHELREDMSPYDWFHEILEALPIDEDIKRMVADEKDLENLLMTYGFTGFLGEFHKKFGNSGGFSVIWAYGDTYNKMAEKALKIANQ